METVDPRPGNYYVSIRRDQRTALLAGPYPQHQTALDQVDAVRKVACDVDPWAAFDAFGTVRTKDDYREPGILNRKGLL